MVLFCLWYQEIHIFSVNVLLLTCVEMSVLPDILVADSDLDYDESQENMGNMLHCHFSVCIIIIYNNVNL